MSTVAGPREAGRRSTFASLAVPNYRRFAAGQIVSLAGTWMQRVAQDWLVLDLTGGSATALGIAVALQFLPTIALSLWGGVLADRVDKRRALMVLQSAMGLCALGLGLAVVTGVVALWHVHLFCVLLGTFSALDVPVRQAFVSELVGPEQVGNAVALNSMTFNLARIIGPSAAGMLIGVAGTGPVFLVNAASFAAVLTGLALMDPARLFRTDPVPRAPGQLREGLRYVRARTDLVAVLALVFLVATFALNFHLTLPLLARNGFGLGADAYGLMTTLLAVGSVAGAVAAARRSRRPRLRLVAAAGLALGALVLAVGLMPTFELACALLVPTGFLALTFTTAANSAVQTSVEPAVRGRVMGLYILLFLGGNPIGAPLLGLVAQEFGPRSPMLVGGGAAALSVIAVTLVLVHRTGRWRSLLRRSKRLG